VQLEKQAALLENEKQKTEDLETTHRQAMDSWTQSLGPRQQVKIFQMKISILQIVIYPLPLQVLHQLAVC